MSAVYGPFLFDAVDDTFDFPLPDRDYKLEIQAVGTGTLTVQYQESQDGTTYVRIPLNPLTGAAVDITVAGIFLRRLGIGRLARLRCTAFTSGSFTLYVHRTP